MSHNIATEQSIIKMIYQHSRYILNLDKTIVFVLIGYENSRSILLSKYKIPLPFISADKKVINILTTTKGFNK